MAKLVRCITNDGAATVMAVDTTDITAQAHKIHKTSKVCTAALGRLMSAAVMMGSLQKYENSSLTLRVNGGGEAGSVIAVADYLGNVRGYIGNPAFENEPKYKGKLDVGGAVGTAGFLSVMRDFGEGEPYIGQVPLVSGEIAEDITSYYAVSEQIPTVCGLGVLVSKDNSEVLFSGGFMIQLLPGADDRTIDTLEKSIKNIKPVTTMLSEGLSPFEICKAVLPCFEIELLDESEAFYRCNCSREKVTKALLSTGRDGLREMAEDPITSVNCHFCNKKYRFTATEIKKLLES